MEQTNRMTYAERGKVQHERTSKAARVLVEKLGVNTETVYMDREFATDTGVGVATVQDIRRFFMQKGLLKTRWEPSPRGRRAYWTVLADLPTFYKVIDDHFRDHDFLVAGPSRFATKMDAPTHELEPVDIVVSPDVKVTIASRETEEVRAIAGPEPVKPTEVLRPLRKADDAEALIAAARQYADRENMLEKKIRELEAFGLHVDHEKMLEAVEWETDERLELVKNLLPYITKLENTNARLASEVVETRQAKARVSELERHVKAQREQIERLVRDKHTPSALATAN